MNKKKIIAWSLLICWLFVIFFFSNQNGSTSSSLSNGILALIEEITRLPLNNDIFRILLRKLAHFTEYLILALFLLNLLRNYKNVSNREFVLTILFCFLYACTDEIHQMFIGGRSPQILDVGIDTLGSEVGILLYLKFMKKKSASKENKHMI